MDGWRREASNNECCCAAPSKINDAAVQPTSSVFPIEEDMQQLRISSEENGMDELEMKVDELHIMEER